MRTEEYEHEEEGWVEDEEDSSSDLLQCPSCGGAVHEEAPRCPRCGDWITPVDPRESRRRFIWLAAAALIILGMMALIVSRAWR
jgi:uncharacterized paraquat-inducible protein A